MKSSSESKLKWLDTGYELFGHIGPEALKIDHLSIILSLSRSSFYHHFGDIENYEEELLGFHLSRIDHFSQALDACKNFEHDLIAATLAFDKEMLFQRQLLMNESNARFQECIIAVKSRTEKKVFELWSEYINLVGHLPSRFSLYKVVRDYYLLHFEQEDHRKISSIISDIHRLITDLKE